MSLEQQFAELEKTLEELEKDELSLEESFAAYAKGMELLKKCNEEIDKVEKKVLVLGGEGKLEEF